MRRATTTETVMRILAAMLILFATMPARAESTVRYTVLCQRKPSGAQVIRTADDGTVAVDFRYRNNGRGPDLKEEFALAKDGTLVRYSVRGTSTFGAPVRETFARRDGRAEWASQSDRGTSDEPGPSAYVPVQCSPEVFMRIVRAAACAAGRADRGAAGRRIDRREAGRRAPGTRRQDPRRVALRPHRHVDRSRLLLGDPWPRDDLLRLDLPGLAPDRRVRLGIGGPGAGTPPGRGGQPVGCGSSPTAWAIGCPTRS